MTRTVCPQCDSAVHSVTGQPAWCPTCEWNLEQRAYPEFRVPGRGFRRARAAAFEVNRRLLDELRLARPDRPGPSRAATAITAAAVLLLLLDVVLVVAGCYWLVTGTIVVKVFALIVLLIGIECRLRFPRLPRFGSVVSRSDAPALHALLDTVGTAIDAPRVDVVLVSNEYNASCGRVGLRRRVVLTLGAPLWGALSEAGRMALLGHELGHLVNGDPSRRFATQPALLTFGRLAALFDPRDMSGPLRAPVLFSPRSLLLALTFVVMGPPYLVFSGAHRALVRTALRDHQRAEVYADALAVQVAGSSGAQELMRMLLFDRQALAAVQRRASAGSADPDDWRAAVHEALDAQRAGTRTAEQISLRMEVSAYASHPPSGLRLRLVRGWPAQPPALAPPRDLLAAVDTELRTHYADSRGYLASVQNIT